MKKKILLGIIMVFAVVCMLAVSISAVDIAGVHYTLDTKNLTAQVSTDNQTATTEVVTIPSVVEYEGASYNVTSIAGSAFAGNSSMKELHILSEHITVIPSSMILNTYTNTDFTKIYIDFSNITKIEFAGLNPSNQSNGNSPQTNSIYYYDLEGNKITTFDFPNIEFIGFAAFQGANFDRIVLYEKNAFGTNNQADGVPYSQTFRKSSATSLCIKGDVETICCYSFAEMTNLKTIEIESTELKMVGTHAFAGCKLLEEIKIDLSKCTIVGGNAFNFSGTKGVAQNLAQWYNLKDEKIVDISSAQKILSLAFNGSNLGSAKVIWPTNYANANFGSTADSGAFRSANLTGMVYFDTAEGTELFIDSWAFRGNEIETVIFGPGVTKIAAAFGGVETIKTIVFLADNVECTSSDLLKDCSDVKLYYKALTTNTDFSQATEIQISSGSLVPYGVCGVDCNVTLASDNSNVVISVPVHTWDNGTVNEGYCPVGAVVDFGCVCCTATKTEGEGTEHSHTVAVIVYESGFFNVGLKTLKCANDECTSVLSEGTEVKPIFTALGYSKSEVGAKSVMQGFAIDQDVLQEYNASTDDKIVGYGVMAASKTALNDEVEVFENGALKNVKVAQVDFSNKSYDVMEIKISGLEGRDDVNGDYVALELYCCGYYLVKNGEAIDSYYASEDTVTDTLVETITYNNITTIK